jgi:hypothetical protein
MKREECIKDGHPPFAGIILIRFSGYFSAIPNFGKAPRELCFYCEKQRYKINYFLCNFSLSGS